MVIKMTKEQERRLECVCGLCDHTYETPSCPYNKMCNADNPAEEEYKIIRKLIVDIVTLNTKKDNGGKIAKKEDKCKKTEKKPSKSKK